MRHGGSLQASYDRSAIILQVPRDAFSECTQVSIYVAEPGVIEPLLPAGTSLIDGFAVGWLPVGTAARTLTLSINDAAITPAAQAFEMAAAGVPSVCRREGPGGRGDARFHLTYGFRAVRARSGERIPYRRRARNHRLPAGLPIAYDRSADRRQPDDELHATYRRAARAARHRSDRADERRPPQKLWQSPGEPRRPRWAHGSDNVWLSTTLRGGSMLGSRGGPHSPASGGTTMKATGRGRSILTLTIASLLASMFVVVPLESVLAAGNSALQFDLAPSTGAVQLNGSSQYMTLGSASQLRSATFTVELWFQRTGAGTPTSTGTGGITNAIPLITKGRAEAETAAADVNYFFGIDATSGKLVADFEEAQVAQGGTTPSLNHPITGNTAIAVGAAWHHAAATYDGTTWNLYLDGAPDGSLAVGRPANALTNALTTVGSALATTGVAAGFFSGSVDEVRIWNAARTAAQIAAAKDTEITGAQTGLLGRWGLNEASGSTAADSSGNTVTGALVGSPSRLPDLMAAVPNTSHWAMSATCEVRPSRSSCGSSARARGPRQAPGTGASPMRCR